MEVLERLMGIVVNQLSVTPEQVNAGAKFQEDLGADSLDVVELIMKIEEEFGVTIPDDAAEKIQTVGDAVQYIQNQKK